MRIAIVHSYYGSSQPSGENVSVDLQADALLHAGHEVALIERRTDHLAGQKGYALKAAATTVSGHGPSPDRDLESFQPDVVHVHNLHPNFGSHWLRRWGPRTVATLHNYRPVCAAGTLFRDGHACSDCLKVAVVPAVWHKCYRSDRLATAPLAVASAPFGGGRAALRHARALVTLNDAAADLYRPMSSGRVFTVPNFVKSIECTPGARARDEFLYAGRLTSEKGILGLVDAWPHDGPALTIVGAGPLRDAVQLRADRKANVSYVGPWRHEYLLKELPRYAALVLPSRWDEGLPTVVLEAAAAGVPVLAAADVAAAKIWEREGFAVVYEPGSPESLLGGIARLASNKDVWRSASVSAYRRYYSRPAWLEAISKVYSYVRATDN